MSNLFEDQMLALHPEVGKVIRRWANLENGLSTALGWLLGIDQFRARILFSSMPNFRARRELISRLGESYLDESCLPEFRSLLKRLQKLGARRNELAHSGIAVEGPNQFIILGDTFPSEAGLTFKWDKMSMKEIRDLSKAIDRLDLDFNLFAARNAHLVFVYSKIHRDPKSETSFQHLYGEDHKISEPPYRMVDLDNPSSEPTSA